MKPWSIARSLVAVCGGFALGWMVARGRKPAVSSPPGTETVRVSAPALPPDSAKEQLTDLARASPPLHRAMLTVRAAAVAQGDLAAAFSLLEGVDDHADRRAILDGIFGWLAGAVPPSEGLKQALALKDSDRQVALGALANAWLGAETDSRWLTSDGRGLVTAAAELLSASETAPPGAAKAWLEAFADHPGRAAIAGGYAAAHIAENPADVLALAKDFTPWERQQFFAKAIPAWAAKDPAAALAWAHSQPEPLSASLRSQLFDAWAEAQPDSARRQLATLDDPAERIDLARALGHTMARAGTREAVAWADSLSDPAVRDAAHDAIYDATPRGIGALMGNEAGFPTIKGVLPGSVAQQAGLQEGDRLVEISGASGDFASLYGMDLQEAVSQIRGEPGQPARLRILRDGPDGRPVEQVLELTRQQLVLPAADQHPK